MSLPKFNKDVRYHQSNPDKPTMSSEQLKALFDQAGVDIKEYINEVLTEELDTLLEGKAQKMHANSGTTYGVGSYENYGHCKTINLLTRNEYVPGEALSAYQGNVLNGKVNQKVAISDIVNNLTSTNTNKPLSANQGKVLKTELDKKAVLLNTLQTKSVVPSNLNNLNETGIYYVGETAPTNAPTDFGTWYIVIQIKQWDGFAQQWAIKPEGDKIAFRQHAGNPSKWSDWFIIPDYSATIAGMSNNIVNLQNINAQQESQINKIFTQISRINNSLVSLDSRVTNLERK